MGRNVIFGAEMSCQFLMGINVIFGAEISIINQQRCQFGGRTFRMKSNKELGMSYLYNTYILYIYCKVLTYIVKRFNLVVHVCNKTWISDTWMEQNLGLEAKLREYHLMLQTCELVVLHTL